MGIHYIGEMREHCPGRILLDSISDGQIEWAELPDNYDLITIGYGEDMKKLPVVTGHKARREQLKRQFPGEEAAVDRYMDLHEGARGDDTRVFLKVLPR